MNKIKEFIKSKKFLSIISSFVCIFIGLLIGFIVLFCMSPSDSFYEFSIMITGGLTYGGISSFSKILANAAPLMMTGLCVLFAYKTGLFNIGVAGQYVMGSFGALIGVLAFKGNWLLGLLLGVLFGALWGAIPGLLKTFCGVSEVISGIMLNWISLFFTNYSFQTYLSSCVDPKVGYKTYSVTYFNANGKLPDLGLSKYLGPYFSISIFIAILVAILIFVILNKTTLGYQLKASGLNKDATRYAGMADKRNVIITMVISGALAGLGASLYYLADLESISVQLSSNLPSVPWNGIVIAFLSQLNPLGAIFASIFIAWISQGAKVMTQTIFPAEFGDLIIGIIVYLSGLTALIQQIILKFKHKKKKSLEVKEDK
ncbi:MAG: ABC transporter permease [Bacilli bacterium]|nr:ABC transporter permease [Bacillales bacterium]MDY2575010.1 ABC transporter permease [Bacilli bacterium]